jgi:hypothetical protein
MWLGEWHLRSEAGESRVVKPVVVDVESKKGHRVDGFTELKKLEGKLGPLPRTRTNETPSDGEHRLFTLPEDIELKNLEGDSALAPGVELKANGQVLAPPSPGYSVKDNAPMAELPRAWVDAWAEKSSSQKNRQADRGKKRHSRIKTPHGERVPEGQRFFFLRSECGRLHDGSRDLAQLIEDLDAINHERCDPPWERWEVEKRARWTFKMPPCTPQKPKELLELVDALSGAWFSAERKGLGARNEARLERLLLCEGVLIGTVIPVGLRVEISFRQVAAALGCHVNTVTNTVKRLKKKGVLRQDNLDRVGPQAGAFVLLDPRGGCDTPTNSSPPQWEGCSGVTGTSQKSGMEELETPHFRHLGPVGYTKEEALCFVEAYGPQTREVLAERLGYSRARDLERLHLRPLVELGLLERRGDLYAIPGDYLERSASVRREPYSTVQLRGVRVWVPDGGVVVVVEETGSVASEEERERADRAEYAAQREKFRKEWEAGLIRAGEHARSARIETRALHEELATASRRMAAAATRSSTSTERRERTLGCRCAGRHRCLDHGGTQRAKEVA